MTSVAGDAEATVASVSAGAVATAASVSAGAGAASASLPVEPVEPAGPAGPGGPAEPAALEVITTDHHTAGEPFRIVTSGVPPIPDDPRP